MKLWNLGQVWSVFSRPEQKITQELLNLEQLDLPFQVDAELQEDSTHSVLKLRYETDPKHSPDLTQIFQSFEKSVHLYQSHIDSIQNHLIGTLIVATAQTDLDIQILQEKLKHQIAQIEVIGYARPTY